MKRLGNTSRDVALIVTPRYLPLLGGMERECALLAAQFGQMGYRPVVITEQLGEDLPEREVVDGVLVIRIPSSSERTVLVQLRVAANLAWIIFSFRHSARFAIVRTFTLPALVMGLLKRLRLIRFPTLVTAETGGAEDDIVALERRRVKRLSKWLVTGNDLLNALCQMNMEHLVEFKYPQSKLTMIPNGIRTTPWALTSAPKRVSRFLFLGRLDERKGIFDLVEATARLRAEGREPTLLIAGDGPDEERLRDQVTARDLADAVDFAGRVPHELIGDLFATVDALVLPSWSEGLPLSVLEAAAHHRVLVLSDVGDMRRLFGESAWIFPPRHIDSLAKSMAGAMDDESPVAVYEGLMSQVAIEKVAKRLELALLGPISVSPDP